MENVIAKKRVLLIDDEARVRTSLKMVLEPLYDILQAGDGHEGSTSFERKSRTWFFSTSSFQEPTAWPCFKRSAWKGKSPRLSC